MAISAQGLAMLSEIDTKMTAPNDILRSITTDEVQVLNGLLDKISAGINA